MEHTHISKPQEPERAILIGAFSGWNDAASAATWAVKFLVNTSHAYETNCNSLFVSHFLVNL